MYGKYYTWDGITKLIGHGIDEPFEGNVYDEPEPRYVTKSLVKAAGFDDYVTRVDTEESVKLYDNCGLHSGKYCRQLKHEVPVRCEFGMIGTGFWIEYL